LRVCCLALRKLFYLCIVINSKHKMNRQIPFTKMHGAGNDYIYVDTSRYTIDHPAETARCWSNRHTGIGADGLVMIGRPADTSLADFTMRIFNADGSEALMCGNASRCIGKYVYERRLTRKTTLRLLTTSGVKLLKLRLHDTTGEVESVSVDMLAPVLSDDSLFRPMEQLPRGVFVSMGNPHYVIFTDNLDQIATLGPLLERHQAFPQRCNIELVQPLSNGRLRVRVWERGSGITQACGTGACAAAVAAWLTGRATGTVRIVMDGGELLVSRDVTNGHVLLSGPAAFVFDGVAEAV